MTRCAIMQPTYLPWMGYFALIGSVDVFIFLDDVEFSRQSWQQRNRIKTQGGAQWLTVPVLLAGKSHQLIRDVRTDETKHWRRQHGNTIAQSYAKAPHFAEHKEWLESVYQGGEERLCGLNMQVIAALAERLGLATRFERSSTLAKSDERSARLVDCCRAVGADEYLSPPGSFDYLEADKAFENSGLALRYLHYEHPQHRQLHGDFIPFLSALDVLLNEGPASGEIVQSGVRPPYTPEELRAVRRAAAAGGNAGGQP